MIVVATPKLPPPPRTAQKRSGLFAAWQVTNFPSAVTRSTLTSWSQARPWARINQPRPPPSVSPAMPVVETIPPVVAMPIACVARSKSSHVAPPCARAVRATPIHLDGAQRGQIADDAALADRAARDVVTTTADREAGPGARARGG